MLRVGDDCNGDGFVADRPSEDADCVPEEDPEENSSVGVLVDLGRAEENTAGMLSESWPSSAG